MRVASRFRIARIWAGAIAGRVGALAASRAARMRICRSARAVMRSSFAVDGERAARDFQACNGEEANSSNRFRVVDVDGPVCHAVAFVNVGPAIRDCGLVVAVAPIDPAAERG